MAITFEGSHPNKMYKEVTKTILAFGDLVAPRGMPTRELQPSANVWDRPDKMVMTTPGRKPNPFFTLFEALWIAGGRGDSESVCFYNKQLAQFLDDGYTDFHAPYGRRIRKWGKHKQPSESFTEQVTITSTTVGTTLEGVELVFLDNTQFLDQFRDCYNLLKRDPDTRQAVISLWIPPFDKSTVTTNDRPCNDMVMFKIRNGFLNMTVINRSNDLHWGLYSTNIMQFSVMHRIMASCLGVKLGRYYHHSDSLHIYHERDDISERVLNTPYDFDVYDHVEPYDLSGEWSSLEDFDADLITFFAMEEGLRLHDEHEEFSSLGDFLSGALCICRAYMLHKKKEYMASLLLLCEAFRIGLRDHVISCFEFVMRKYQKPKVNLEDEASSIIARMLQDCGISDASAGEILYYIKSH